MSSMATPSELLNRERLTILRTTTYRGCNGLGLPARSMRSMRSMLVEYQLIFQPASTLQEVRRLALASGRVTWQRPGRREAHCRLFCSQQPQLELELGGLSSLCSRQEDM
jgi:hypothetical protein